MEKRDGWSWGPDLRKKMIEFPVDWDSMTNPHADSECGNVWKGWFGTLRKADPILAASDNQPKMLHHSRSFKMTSVSLLVHAFLLVSEPRRFKEIAWVWERSRRPSPNLTSGWS